MAGRPGQALDDHDNGSWQEAAVPGLILAGINPSNTPHGYNWTFAFPMILFAVIAVILYVLFSRPHRRVPARAISLPARSAAPPAPDVARAASVAGGLSVAEGGGSGESHLEPGGAYLVASTDAEPVDTTPAEQADSAGTEESAGSADPKDGEGTE
jgi:hypothetical protein